MKHSSTRNVIERAFGVFKDHWAVLREKSYYPLQVQCHTILACCLLHNLINREMTYCDNIDNVDEGDSTYATTTAAEDIQYIEMTNEWSQWRDELAKSHLAAKGLLNKPFSYYDELAYVFDRDRTTGHFAETFADVGSNEPVGFEGFDMPDETRSSLQYTVGGLTCPRRMYVGLRVEVEIEVIHMALECTNE
ncbi:retrotransposon protein [Cucumis melo var. makuwa]|uniref:Retrotransposon protein n=1 Tax=Cucumis melo var. makuwa TaxID=1194695 RepID=A0A5A7SIW5_CUCMM|nr:retrotransposon protein [Cucumis melo var. makuwa]TYK11590.1 retrotransposon protein [Cucumis melo var. makuwa]